MLDGIKRSIYLTLPIKKVSITLVVGSCYCRVWLGDQLIQQIRTCLVVNKHTKEVVAHGDQAWLYYQQENNNAQVIFPVYRGEIAHYEYFSIFVDLLLKNVASLIKGKALFTSWDVVLLTPALFSPAKKKLTQKAFSELSFANVTFKSELLHDADTILKKTRHDHMVILNVGCQQTQLGMFSQGTITHSERIIWGGIGFTKIVIAQIRSKYKCEVGFKTAEEVKINSGSLVANQVKKKLVSGKDVLSHISVSHAIESKVFYEGFNAYATELVDSCTDFFSSVHPTVLTESLKNGIFLTGMSGKMKGLDKLLQKKFNTEVIAFEN